MKKINWSLAFLLLLALLSAMILSSLKTKAQDNEDFESLTSATDKYDESVDVEYDDSGFNVRLRFAQSTDSTRTIVYEYIVDPQKFLGQTIESWNGGRITLGGSLGYKLTGIVTLGDSSGRKAVGGAKGLCFRIIGFEQNGVYEKLSDPERVCINQKGEKEESACVKACNKAYSECENPTMRPSYCMAERVRCKEKCNE